MDRRLVEELERIDALLARLRGEREELDRLIRDLERDRVDLILHWEGGRRRPEGELMADVTLEALRAIGRPARAREVYEVMRHRLGYRFLGDRHEKEHIQSVFATLSASKGRFRRVSEGLYVPAEKQESPSDFADEPDRMHEFRGQPCLVPERRFAAPVHGKTKVESAAEALRMISRPARAREIATVMARQFGYPFEGDPPNSRDINRLLSTLSKASERFARIRPGSGLWILRRSSDDGPGEGGWS